MSPRQLSRFLRRDDLLHLQGPKVPTLLSFPKHQIPRDIAIQIRSYTRIQWPFMFGKGGKLWEPPADNPLQPMNFVLMEDEALISHAEANRRGEIEFA